MLLWWKSGTLKEPLITQTMKGNAADPRDGLCRMMENLAGPSEPKRGTAPTEGISVSKSLQTAPGLTLLSGL
ncbi:hypothetical protein AAFF_G00131290 [Aldrovandia affinis]|uniref:Uncharacterized protein n=1 Tax=Aldrovandia affinis TaxID=143900 RepID=A0AAD7RR44_9TELE|nr:hypothetical protein AAFF_G00131290 [Aldrovandia affinis]